jgi:protein-disulfide isomerase
MVALALSGALLGAHAGTASAAPAKAAVANDWSRVVSATPEGGIVMGNPKAPLILVEYGSLTCSHCKHFAETGMKPLVANYVKTGKVRYEFRSYLLNAYDVAATLLARCNGPRGFFALADTMFATQDRWLGAAQAIPKARLEALQSAPPEKMVPQLATLTGMQKIVAPLGLPLARANKCLSDKAASERLIAFAEKGRARGVKATPTFFLNGRQLGGATWEAVEPELKGALAR